MYARILKINLNHDAAGRFAKAPGSKAGSGSGGKSVTGLTEHFAKYDDSTVSLQKILANFAPGDVREVEMMTLKAEKAPLSTTEHVGPDGAYTAERQAKHAKIINTILSDAAVKAATPKPGEKPTYIVLGGRGGSGKSAFTHNEKEGRPPTVKEFDSRKFLTLDSDAIKEALIPPYEGWNAFSVHDESAHIFDQVTKQAQKMGLNIIHDSTLRSASVEKTILSMKADGYRVEGHYMFLPRQEAAKRAVQRYLGNGPDDRGRLVPPAVVLGNDKNEANFEYLSKHFEKWSAYDNQGAKGSLPKLIKRGKVKVKKS